MAKTTKKGPMKADSKSGSSASAAGEKAGSRAVTKKPVVAKAATPSVTKKRVAKKASAKKGAVVQKTAVKKKAGKKGPVRKKAVANAIRTVTAQERHDMIAQAAYLRSESRGFIGDAADDWLFAEEEVDARLKKAGVKVNK